MLRKSGEAELLDVQQQQKLWRRPVGHSTVWTGASVILHMFYPTQWQGVVQRYQHSISDLQKTIFLCDPHKCAAQVPVPRYCSLTHRLSVACLQH